MNVAQFDTELRWPRFFEMAHDNVLLCNHLFWKSVECPIMTHSASGEINGTCTVVYQAKLILNQLHKPYMEIKCHLDAKYDFYCRPYCLLNMFRAPLCPSSGARDYYTEGCCLWYLVLGFQVLGMVWSWGYVCCSSPQTGHITLSPTPYREIENQSTKYHRQQPSV
jgi:hypothetical protein